MDFWDNISTICDNTKIVSEVPGRRSKPPVDGGFPTIHDDHLSSTTRNCCGSRLLSFCVWCKNKHAYPSLAPVGRIADLLIHLYDICV